MFTMLPSLNLIVEDLRPAFTAASFTTHSHLVLVWLVHLGKHTLYRVCQNLAPGSETEASSGHSFHKQYNFFERSAWDPRVLAQKVALMIHKRLPFKNTITLIVDDTLSHKRGKSVWGLGWFRDAVASTQKRVATASGHNWVVIAIAFCSPFSGAPIFAIPLCARLHQAGKQHPSLSELAKEMLQDIQSWYPDHQLTLLGDGAYASGELLGDLPNGVEFVGWIRSNAAVYDPKIPVQPKGKKGPKPKKGPRLASPKAAAALADQGHEGFRWHEVTVQIYGKCQRLWALSYEVVWPKVLGLRPIQIVVVRDPDNNMKDAYLFTTKLDASLEWVIEQYSWRWGIEVLFASSKQILDLQDPQHWCESSVKKMAPWIWSVHAVLMVWYLTEGHQSEEAKHMRNQMSDWDTEWSLAHMRRVLIRCVLNNTINPKSDCNSELRNYVETLKNWALLAL